MAAITFSLNGSKQTVQAQPDMPLLWVLRDTLQLTGTKYGCGIALCGACTVHVDGHPTRSCVTPVGTLAGIMSAASLLEKTSHPTDADIDEAMRGNICRCGTYSQIRRAMHRAAEIKSKGVPA